jgi:hypothetical protein
MAAPPGPNWFIDIRTIPSSKKLTLDLARHLPRRAAVGPIAIITDRPTVLLSVLKKRWTILIREVQRQYSSTLQTGKKEGLRRELIRLQNYQFAVASKRQFDSDIVVMTVDDVLPDDMFCTIYLTIPLSYERLLPVTEHLPMGGFLVTYVGWPGEVY